MHQFLLNTDFDYSASYQIDCGDLLVVYSEPMPQIITVHDDRFHVPLYDCPPSHITQQITRKDVIYKILYHVANKVKCVNNIKKAKEIFKLRDITFGEIIEINIINKPILKFALSGKDFRGMFVVHTKPITKFGCFMFMKSIIRIK